MSNTDKLTPVSLWFKENKKCDVKGVYSPSKGSGGVILSVQLLQ